MAISCGVMFPSQFKLLDAHPPLRNTRGFHWFEKRQLLFFQRRLDCISIVKEQPFNQQSTCLFDENLCYRLQDKVNRFHVVSR